MSKASEPLDASLPRTVLHVPADGTSHELAPNPQLNDAALIQPDPVTAESKLAHFAPVRKEHALLRSLERRFESALLPNSRRSLADCFERLLAYLVMHFATEDRMMVETHYPDMPMHRQEHHLALANFRHLEQSFLDGNRASADEAMAFVKHWRNTHIPGSDKRLSKYVSSWSKASRRAQRALNAASPNAGETHAKSAEA